MVQDFPSGLSSNSSRSCVTVCKDKRDDSRLVSLAKPKAAKVKMHVNSSQVGIFYRITDKHEKESLGIVKLEFFIEAEDMLIALCSSSITLICELCQR